jgi:hypothetical protein
MEWKIFGVLIMPISSHWPDHVSLDQGASGPEIIGRNDLIKPLNSIDQAENAQTSPKRAKNG